MSMLVRAIRQEYTSIGSDDHLHHPNLRIVIVIVIPGISAPRTFPPRPVKPDTANGLDRQTSFQVEQVRAVSTA